MDTLSHVGTLSIQIMRTAIVNFQPVASVDFVSTRDPKSVKLNIRMSAEVRDDLHAVAILRGATASSLLHQYIVRITREEKQRSPAEFEAALTKARALNDTQAQPEPRALEPGEREQIAGRAPGTGKTHQAGLMETGMKLPPKDAKEKRKQA